MRSRQDFFSHAFFKKKKKKLRKEKFGGAERNSSLFRKKKKKKGYSVDTFYTKSIVSIKTLPM